MAIIKCPECGHDVSDKAETCPHCGVKIAGNVTRCPQCGNIYLKELGACPKCHHRYGEPVATANSAVGTPPIPPQRPKPSPTTPKPQPKKSNRTVLIVSLIIALLIVGVVLYFYKEANTSKERDAYEFAMTSEDPAVLQNYLDNFKDADAQHFMTIKSRLDAINKQESEWNAAMASNSKSELEAFLSTYPDTPHKGEINHKIDSIDWDNAQRLNTVEALQQYLDAHVNGEHVDDANTALGDIKAKTLLPEEKQMINDLFRTFFQGINVKDVDRLESVVATPMTSFLNKADATDDDLEEFLHKIYKENVSKMVWRVNNDMKIDKKEVGDDKYEYIVKLSATKQETYKDDSPEQHTKYRINGRVNADGKISTLNMIRIVE